MNKKKTFVVLAVTMLALTACGKNRAGNYVGTETAVYSGVASSPSSVTLSLQDANAEAISGTWSSNGASGTFTGTLKSDRIESITLVKNGSSNTMSYNTGYPGMYNPYQQNPYGQNPYVNTNGTSGTVCAGTFTGSLNLSDNRISGTLTQAQNSGYSSGCTQITVDASKSS